jgi:hypothetical protein
MATTTNYGWTTPDDTALVKDGAAAIRTLGTSVDTTTKNLNPETTLGDIAYRSSTANVKTRLGLGTAGQVLTVNSGANAPEWATASSGGMTLISTTTLTGASVTLSSIPSTYKDLRLVIRNYLPATDNAQLYVRFNGDSTANRYSQRSSQFNTQLQYTLSEVNLPLDMDNGSSQGLYNIIIPDYTNTTTRKLFNYLCYANDTTTTADFRYAWGFGLYNQISAISSITLLPDNGNFTSGSALLYGVS